MDNNLISLSYLETLSTADLLVLADEYGVDIPEHLNRRFIISELFEILEEMTEDAEMNDLEDTATPVKSSDELPETYNETKIGAVMRNPSWAYVFWDISSYDKTNFLNSSKFSKLVLKIFFDSQEKKQNDQNEKFASYDITISEKDKAQYILLPPNKNDFCIELHAEFTDGKTERLATSRKIKIPKGATEITLNSLYEPLSPIMQLSSMQKIMKTQYDNHRQSFE